MSVGWNLNDSTTFLLPNISFLFFSKMIALHQNIKQIVANVDKVCTLKTAVAFIFGLFNSVKTAEARMRFNIFSFFDCLQWRVQKIHWGGGGGGGAIICGRRHLTSSKRKVGKFVRRKETIFSCPHTFNFQTRLLTGTT